MEVVTVRYELAPHLQVIVPPILRLSLHWWGPFWKRETIARGYSMSTYRDVNSPEQCDATFSKSIYCQSQSQSQNRARTRARANIITIKHSIEGVWVVLKRVNRYHCILLNYVTNYRKEEEGKANQIIVSIEHIKCLYFPLFE